MQVAITSDTSDASERTHDPTSKDADRGANVVDAGQRALSAAAAALPWVQYDQLLSMCLRNLRVGHAYCIITTHTYTNTREPTHACMDAPGGGA